MAGRGRHPQFCRAVRGRFCSRPPGRVSEARTMRLLVTGASWLLGLNLSLAMHRRHAITGVDRSRLVGVPFELLRADLLDAGAEARILDSVRPEAVVHCAAWADMDACEVDPAGAQRVNAELPGTLAQACTQRDIRLIHISTD